MNKHGVRDAARPPGMADVARVAGVSAQTVSRALAGHPNVQEETRAKVLAAVEQLGYRRNNAARMLSSGRSRTIGVVTLQTGFYSRTAVTVGIERAAQGPVTRSAGGRHAPPRSGFAIEAAMPRLADQHVEGVVPGGPLIHASRQIEQLHRRVPTITVDGSRTSATEVVAVDQSLAARLATRSRSSTLGHATVCTSRADEWLDSGESRPGLARGARGRGQGGAAGAGGRLVTGLGYRNGLILGRIIPDVTAVFVASDEMAFGVIRALHELGRRVPEDISVVGVDDIALAEYCSPSLTTVAQPFAEMGELAVSHRPRVHRRPRRLAGTGHRRAHAGRPGQHRSCACRALTLDASSSELATMFSGVIDAIGITVCLTLRSKDPRETQGGRYEPRASPAHCRSQCSSVSPPCRWRPCPPRRARRSSHRPPRGTPIDPAQYALVHADSESPAYPAPPALDGTALAAFDKDPATQWTVAYDVVGGVEWRRPRCRTGSPLMSAAPSPSPASTTR